MDKNKKDSGLFKRKIASISLRDQLIFLFVGAMLLGMVAQSLMMFCNLYTNTRKGLLENINTTVSAVANSMNQSFIVTENLVLEIAATEGVQQWLNDEDYFDRDGKEFNLRKADLQSEMQRILVYSNAKKLNLVEYAVIYESDEILDYTAAQSVSVSFIKRGASELYDEIGIREESYVYFQQITEPADILFHVRRLKADFIKDTHLVIMVATNEKDIREKYSDLLSSEGVVVYLTDNNNQIISSSREEEIGSYLNDTLVRSVENGEQEVELDKKYLITSEVLSDSDMELYYLYPTELLSKQVFDGIQMYLILCIGLVLICLGVALIMGIRSTKFLDELVYAIQCVREKKYNVKIKSHKNPEINRIGMAFNDMTKDIKELIQNKYESQLLMSEMEIRFLQHQMNPHFLFNVLLTIQIKAKRCNDETIYKMVSTLSALLRASIFADDIQKITVEEELRYVEFYMYLQQMRFEDKFTYEILIEDETLKSYEIPKFSIEPIAENAVVHGVENCENGGHILIELSRDENELLISVKDNGIGFDVEKYKKEIEKTKKDEHVREKIGLRNVDLRVRHIYGEKYGLEIESQINVGTVVKIRIPIEERDGDV